jgi:O-antigen/teichoic acid export membrane protein
VYLARVLGAEGFGMYSWVMAVYSYLYLFANFGFDTFGIRKIASTNQTEVINGVLVLRGAYVFLLILIVASVNFFVLSEPNYLLLLQSVSILIVPFNVQYVFRGLSKGKYDGTYRTVQAALFLLFVYLFIRENDILSVPILWFASSAIVGVTAFVFVRKATSLSVSIPSFKKLKEIFYESIPVGIAGALILFYLNSGTVILGMYVSGHSLGLYSVAFRIYYFGYTILGLLYVAFLPSLSRYFHKEFSIVRSSYSVFLLLCSACIATCGTALSSLIISMFFGEQYSEAVPVLRILMLSLAAACVNVAYMNPLQAVSKDVLFIKLLFARAVMFVILCFILIPSYGITGAAFSALIAESMIAVFSYIAYVKVMKRIQNLTHG